MQPTADPWCVIEEQRDGTVIYRAADGDRWAIYGECNRCGACFCDSEGVPVGDGESLIWVGPVGEPGAFLDPHKRLDMPVRPRIAELFPTCVLSGEYL